MPFLKNSFLDLLHLLFPATCMGCTLPLVSGEVQICSTCLHGLPYTDQHLNLENLVARQFWGRIPCHAAMAMLFFKKGGTVQQLIHHLKYSNQPELGIRMGILLGERLLSSPFYQDIDFLIPVPLHKKRLKKRGYNQSYSIAQGISQVLKTPISTKHLLRKTATDSQTNKGRFLRFENMSAAFELQHPEELTNQHLLLIDDVLTTGATLEACAIALLQARPEKISIAALAFVT
ncbi:ComF family protein [Pedobacter sp. N36a]|uniref:ComF family protein n=1 Tax=Pedobacter sp. N36a TaxID=2767996 RepID=UPI001656E483|nr:phosphoribosyltransferase family protein [Pedobacter sp. N36a]MBC8986137.1 ComF family protein [Pedobacter sp. N36a]